MRFSQRIGKSATKTMPQIESMDERLKNRLWNSILDDFFNTIGNELLMSPSNSSAESKLGKVYKTLWKDFFYKSIDEIPLDRFSRYGNVDTSQVLNSIKGWYSNASWYEIYDFIEYIAEVDDNMLRSYGEYPRFTKACDLILEKEVAGYRLINGKVIQITSKEEVQEVEEATNQTKKWKSVNTHLQRAIDLLADRKNPDYRNSIKESISAIESLCKIIAGDDNATLRNALSEFEKKYAMNGALKNAFSSLYGYTSDASGIRHGLLEADVAVGFEEAKFMLVTCSAFINYLKKKIDI